MSWQSGAAMGKYNRMYHLLYYVFLSVYSLLVIAFASTAHISVAKILLMCLCISIEYQFGTNICYFDTCFDFSSYLT